MINTILLVVATVIVVNLIALAIKGIYKYFKGSKVT